MTQPSPADGSRPHQKRTSTVGAPDAVSWAAADTAAAPLERAAQESVDRAQELSRRLAALGDQREDLENLVRTWSNTADPQFAGRVHEWWHTATFNMDAAAQESPLRAFMTEALGSPHDPADLIVQGDSGDTLVQIQSKVLEGTARRIHEFAQDKYSGMQLLAPSDHIDQAQETIAQRISAASPGFLKEETYLDVQPRLTDHVAAGGINSTPIQAEELRDASAEPDRMFDRLAGTEDDGIQSAQHDVLMSELQSVAVASLAAGGAAAAVSGLIQAARNGAAVRAGRMSPTAAAAATAGQAGTAFVRGLYVGAAGQGLALSASNGFLPDALGAGTLPLAVARASWSMGEIGLKYARGEISASEAAADSAESMTRISLVWAGAVVGQTLIPIPVVGAAIGATCASLSASIAAKGLGTITAMATEARAEEELLAALQVEVAAAIVVIEEEQRILEEISAEYDLWFGQEVLPAFAQLDHHLNGHAYLHALATTTDLILSFGGTPAFTTRDEFDRWMFDGTSLQLRTNPPRPG